MVLDRTTKTLIAVLTMVGALFLIIEHLVSEDPLEDWWLAAILLGISLAFWVWLWQEEQAKSSAMVVSEIQEDDKLSQMQEWVADKENPALKVVEEAPAKAEPEPSPEPEPTPEPESSVAEQVIEAEPDEAPVIEEAKADESPSVEKVAEAMAAPESPKEEKTEAPKAKASDKPDDLRKVNGIGPKYMKVLNDAGISTFAQLAETSADRIEEIIDEAGVRRIGGADTWPKQAEFLAKGDEAGLQKYLDEN